MSVVLTTVPCPDVDVDLDVDIVRERFDSTQAGTVGLEEEVLILDPGTLLPVPRPREVVAAASNASIKPELPNCQVELVTRPHVGVDGAVRELARSRAALSEICRQLDVVPAAAAVHPWAPSADSSSSTRHRAIEDEFGEVARRQLVGSLQVHVALGSADCALAVYNALRSYLPEIAALAACAPFAERRDTGLASIRPLICGQLPRQGVPPAIASWQEFVDDLAWGRASGAVPEPRRWWWELRPHIAYGTLEVRVADVQPTIGDTAAIAGVVAALVGWLATRYHDGQPLPTDPTWRIAENRWRALRHGVHGQLADLVSGEGVPTTRRLHDLLDRVEQLTGAGLDPARALIARSGADQLRDVGLARSVSWLAARFEDQTKE